MHRIDRGVEADTVGNLLIARILERDAATDHDRNVCGVETMAVVRIQIDVGIWIAVARQKFFDSKSPGGVVRTDKHDVSNMLLDQLRPTQDEGAHQDFAQLAVGLHNRQQGFATQLDHLACPAHPRSHQCATAGEQVDLARELAGPVTGDDLLLRFTMQVRFANDSAPAYVRALQLELRFDQCKNHAGWSYQVDCVWQD